MMMCLYFAYVKITVFFFSDNMLCAHVAMDIEETTSVFSSEYKMTNKKWHWTQENKLKS